MPPTVVTWQDVQQTPEDGKRREAIGGELYVTGPATVRHQRVSQRLRMRLYRLLEDPGYGEILPGPIGVEFPESGEGVQPDMVFISKERQGIIADDWIRGAPDLIVETVSPDTADRDRGVKLDLYRRHRVPEYWIVDPDDEAVDVWQFRGPEADESEAIHERFTDRMPVRIGGEVVGHIDLTEIFVREF